MARLKEAVVLAFTCAVLANATPLPPQTGRDVSVGNNDKQETAVRRSLAVGDGYWSTQGNKIVDRSGNQVFFSGVNWNGFEGVNCIVDGLWGGLDRSYKSHLAQMRETGFNLIRLAFAGSCMQAGVKPASTAVDYAVNSDLKGLTTIEAMRKVIQAADGEGIRVILDYHRRDKTPLDGSPEDGLWFDATHPASVWLDTWRYVAESFKDEKAVVGVDLWNEPHDGSHPGPFWTDDAADPYNFRAAAKAAADVVQAVQPAWLICINGMWQNSWWGGNLQGVRQYPLALNVPNKLVYTIHDYGPVVRQQSWFDDPSFPNNMPAFWDSMWGFVHTEGIAPVWVGEFGSTHEFTSALTLNQKESKWLTTLTSYIQQKGLCWTWFTWGPNSRDTGGMLETGWKTVNSAKLASLKPIMHPAFRASTGSASTPGKSGARSRLTSVANTRGLLFMALPIVISMLSMGFC